MSMDIINDDQFIHQIKWDGIRGIIYIDNDIIKIYSRKGIEYTHSYPELSELPKQFKSKQAILDGELVVISKGIPSFYHSLKRNSTKNKLNIQRVAKLYPVKYLIFDILMINGQDIRLRTLKERQDVLHSNISNSSLASITDNFSNGKNLYEVMKQKGMEGIVSKRLDSKYISGKKHKDWYKTKIAKKMLCAIIGAKKKHGRVSSIILGIYRDNVLINIGAIYSGLRQNDLSLLNDYIKTRKISETIDTILIAPELTCWVRYTEWTMHNSLRNPILLGFSKQSVDSAIGEEIII